VGKKRRLTTQRNKRETKVLGTHAIWGHEGRTRRPHLEAAITEASEEGEFLDIEDGRLNDKKRKWRARGMYGLMAPWVGKSPIAHGETVGRDWEYPRNRAALGR